MEDLKVVFASNLIALRASAGMTQAELGEKISYSDKSISKWERAEALPDVAVVKNLADLFGVSVDFMLESHGEWKPEHVETTRSFDEKMVTGVAFMAIWTLAALLFVIFWIFGYTFWVIFLCAAPISLITALVLNSIWNEGRYNMLIVLAIVFAVFAVIYFFLRKYTPWQLVFVLVPAELLVLLSFQIRKGRPPESEGKK